MATIILQAAGTFIGSFFGPVGAAIGSAAGSLAGYGIDRALLSGTQHIEGPRLSALAPFSAEEGAAIPRVYGTARIAGMMIWATRLKEVKKSEREGGKGGPKVTSYSYFGNVAFGLCEGPIAGVRRVWADGRELDLSRIEMRVHLGSEDQAPDPLVEVKQGAGNAPAYRGTAYAVFERLPLEDYGNRIPQVQFEVLRPVGSLHESIRAVTLIPGATEYGLSPGRVRKTLRGGDHEVVNRHVLSGRSDLVASLDELQALCPNLRHIALVVAWFGDDLRCGACRIRPAVTSATGSYSLDWKVSGVSRGAARVVSSHGGAASFGGTPADRTVIDAIAEIKARGLGVTLYPFVMMDIAAGNALPDPYGAPAQAAYPWRGRITASPAPGLPGSADKTAAARTQVASFCGTAEAADFSRGSETIGFHEPTGDWGYRRFVLHHAHLAARAGGVDAILLGSELRGLTTLRDGAGRFPFVEVLTTLAGDVRGIVGPDTKITYGADWSEYFGHQPADGSGDVFFHLDPLWAHPDIDAVGVDNYMPLADWRDVDYGGGNPDGFAGPYDPAGLRRMITAGEGHDWYYASAADRAARERSAITDGTGGKPWVFRNKDLRNWWRNRHFDRPGGIESATPTAWVPQAKPIWFTELGCAAVDKGPNQPNVFPDPKSAESAAPYFSSGGRSDLAQSRFLQAHYSRWDEASDDFEDEGNPVSSVTGERMVERDRIYAWAWDARPFPAFPADDRSWRDGGNWALGHWLTGRLSGVAVSDLIAAILADHGLPAADTSGADGTLAGYVVSEPGTARAEIEPLVDLFGLSAGEDGGRLSFAVSGRSALAVLDIEEIVLGEDGAVQLVRAPVGDAPGELVLGFRDPAQDYQTATVRQIAPGGSGRPQAAVSLPAMMETAQAQALAADWLRRAKDGRERLTVAVPATERRIGPGSVVRVLPVSAGALFLVDQVEDGLVRTLSARRIVPRPPADQSGGVATKIAGGAAEAGAPLALFLDLPLPPAGGAPEDQLKAALWARPWKSEALHVSPTDSGFAARAISDRPATLGTLTASLGPGFEGRYARGGAIEIELASGELSDTAEALLFNGANAAAIRAADGGWEVVQFLEAEEVAPSRWRLSGLLRGQLGTTEAMEAGAPAGADFVLLDEAVIPAGLASSEIGLTLNWRAGPTGYDVSDEYVTAVTVAGGLAALRPYAPVHLAAKLEPDGDVAVAWIRRGRIDADSWDGAEIPLGEDAELYRVEIRDGAGSVLRTADVGAPAWTYPAASIAADFGGVPAALYIAVAQVSRRYGPGPAARLTFGMA